MSDLTLTENRLYGFGGRFLGLVFLVDSGDGYEYYPDKGAGPFEPQELETLAEWLHGENLRLDSAYRAVTDCTVRTHRWGTPYESQKNYVCQDCGEPGFWVPKENSKTPGIGPIRTQAELDTDGARDDW